MRHIVHILALLCMGIFAYAQQGPPLQERWSYRADGGSISLIDCPARAYYLIGVDLEEPTCRLEALDADGHIIWRLTPKRGGVFSFGGVTTSARFVACVESYTLPGHGVGNLLHLVDPARGTILSSTELPVTDEAYPGIQCDEGGKKLVCSIPFEGDLYLYSIEQSVVTPRGTVNDLLFGYKVLADPKGDIWLAHMSERTGLIIGTDGGALVQLTWDLRLGWKLNTALTGPDAVTVTGDQQYIIIAGEEDRELPLKPTSMNEAAATVSAMARAHGCYVNVFRSQYFRGANTYRLDQVAYFGDSAGGDEERLFRIAAHANADHLCMARLGNNVMRINFLPMTRRNDGRLHVVSPKETGPMKGFAKWVNTASVVGFAVTDACVMILARGEGETLTLSCEDYTGTRLLEKAVPGPGTAFYWNAALQQAVVENRADRSIRCYGNPLAPLSPVAAQ